MAVSSREQKPKIRYYSTHSRNRPFATYDHMVQEGKLIIIPALGHQNKGKSIFTGSGLFVLISQCGNINELALQHGGFFSLQKAYSKDKNDGYLTVIRGKKTVFRTCCYTYFLHRRALFEPFLMFLTKIWLSARDCYLSSRTFQSGLATFTERLCDDSKGILRLKIQN